ncbi:hypothetical protein GCM10020255_098090 [Rhodococcus baikonurensis]
MSIERYRADIIFVDGGRNDLHMTPMDLFPVMTSYIDAVRDAWPDARLVIIVPTYVTPVPYEGYEQFVSALRSYGESVAATVIDPVADGWYADVDLASLKFEDGVHPNAVGNAVIAQKLVESLTTSGVIREARPMGNSPMNPSGFFEVLRDRWIVVGISTVLGLLAGVLLTLLTPTTFKSSTELFLTTPGWGTPTTLGNADSSPFQGDEFSQQRAGTYTRLAEGADFSARVASRLGENGLRDIEVISVRVVPDTVLLEISGTADSADRALQLTNAASDEMNETIRRLETPSGTLIPTVQPLTVVTASAPTSPSGPHTIPNVLLGLVVGSMVGMTGVILAAARSKAVQGIDQLAAWTGLPVLESIPYVGDRGFAAEEGAQSAVRSSFERLQFNRDLIGAGTPASPVLVTAADKGEISGFAGGGIADAACALGYSVVLVDCNFRSSRAHIELGSPTSSCRTASSTMF